MQDTKHFPYILLYHALIRLRAEGVELKDQKIYHICDLLHDVPLMLANAETPLDYDRINSYLSERAEGKGMKEWLDQEFLVYLEWKALMERHK